MHFQNGLRGPVRSHPHALRCSPRTRAPRTALLGMSLSAATPSAFNGNVIQLSQSLQVIAARWLTKAEKGLHIMYQCGTLFV